MQPLLDFLNGLTPEARDAFADRCGTTIGYLRKAISTKQLLGEALCINIERESRGLVRCEQLRPTGVDWAYLRSTRPWNPSTHPVARDESRAASRSRGDRPGDVADRRAPERLNEHPDPRRAPRAGRARRP
jgi:DNA-binding transcriptional regulator YdaS (Cro superfamily)